MKTALQIIFSIIAAIIFNALLSNPVTQVFAVSFMVFALVVTLAFIIIEANRTNY